MQYRYWRTNKTVTLAYIKSGVGYFISILLMQPWQHNFVVYLLPSHFEAYS